MSLMRFVLYGAVGFGIGVVVGGAGFLIPVGGALGGASLGLALKDRRRVALLALMGALGATFAVIVIAVAGPVVWDSPGTTATVLGGVIGTLLGVAFWDWKRVVALGAAGAVGFGLGGAIAGDSPSALIVVGVLGGASLGVTLWYLENRWSPPTPVRRGD